MSNRLSIEFSPEPGRRNTSSPMLVTREERLTVLRRRKDMSLSRVVALLAECGVTVTLSTLSLVLRGAPGRYHSFVSEQRREKILSACEVILERQER